MGMTNYWEQINTISCNHENKIVIERLFLQGEEQYGVGMIHIFIGNMKRGVDVISPTLEKTIFTLQSPHMSAVLCRFDAHPSTVGMLAGATCLGQVYMSTLG